jgi:hypothetical protein
LIAIVIEYLLARDSIMLSVIILLLLFVPPAVAAEWMLAHARAVYTDYLDQEVQTWIPAANSTVKGE